MADKSENKAGPKQDDLIAKLVKDPKAPPDALLLGGFVGASSDEGYTRLYLTATLEDYVEIPNEAILHTQEVPKDQSPMGGSLVWIKSDAELIHGKVGPNRPKAKFLEGRIQQEFVKAQAAGVPFGPLPPRTLPDGPGCPTQFGPACPTQVPLHCPTLLPQLCPTRIPLHCPTHFPQLCPTMPTHCCPPPTPLHGCPPPTPLHGCPPHTPLHGCPPSLLGAICPSAMVIGCTHVGPECPPHTLPPQCPIHNTFAPPCPVGSGPFCGGLGGSAACQPGGPVQVGPVQAAAHFAAAQQFQQPSVGCLTIPACSVNAPNCPTTDFACTVVGLNCPSQQGICTAVDPNCNQPTQQFPCAQTFGCPPTQNLACPTHHVGCTVDLRTCINTVNPQQCPVLSANCPTPACPTHHVVACTVGGPACGITGPHCPVVSAFCPTPACPTQNQLACRPSVLVQCPTLQIVHCPIPSVHQLHCGPSVVEICPSLRLDCLPSQGIHLCPSRPAILCGGASGGFGCGQQGPGPEAGGVAHAAAFGAAAPALHLTSPVICQPVHTLFCPQTQHFVQCHPTILCHTQQIICLQVTQVGCPFPSQFCPSAFCPSGPACGGGGFGGFGGLGQ